MLNLSYLRVGNFQPLLTNICYSFMMNESRYHMNKDKIKNSLDTILRYKCILAIFLGIILILLSELKDTFGDIIRGLLRESGITFIIIGTMLVFFERHLNKYVENELGRIESAIQKLDVNLGNINDKIKTIEDSKLINDMGLKGIYTSVGDESIFEKLDSAYSIDIMSNTAKNFTIRYSEKIAYAIVNHECKVRFLISDPKNKFWNNECMKEGLCPSIDIQREISDVIAILEKKVKQLEKYHPPLKAGSIEVKEFSNFPTCSIIIVNNEIARHIPYLPFSHSTQVPNYDVTSEGRLFEHYQKTFERVWGQQTSITVIKMDLDSPR